MKNLFRYCTSLFLCVLFCLFAGCEKNPVEDPATGGGSGENSTAQRGNVEGVVTDKATGLGLAQARVVLMGEGLDTFTDEDGAFSLTAIKAGSYKLQVSKNGYAACVENIVVEANGTTRTTIVLTALDLQICDTNGNYMPEPVLMFDEGNVKSVFLLKNAGSSIVEWDIPTLAEDWIAFSKRSGKLAPGASEKIVLTIDAAVAFGENSVATVYIGSSAGDLQLTVRSIGAMIYVQGGTFMMGATEEQLESSEPAWSDSSALPVHSVTLDGFYIGKFEVTQAQWESVMGTTIEEQHAKQTYNYWIHGKGDTYPMYFVNWEEAVQFCNKLSEKTGKKFRLPTEAEWEYAARGGQHMDGTKYAGSDECIEVAWEDHSSSAHPVGKKKPNGLDLYDMSGNILEWCLDWWGDYSGLSVVNPQGPANGKYRIRRGGAFDYLNECNRVSRRSSMEPWVRMPETGFRVVCEQ